MGKRDLKQRTTNNEENNGSDVKYYEQHIRKCNLRNLNQSGNVTNPPLKKGCLNQDGKDDEDFSR